MMSTQSEMNRPGLRTIFRVVWIVLLAMGITQVAIFLSALHDPALAPAVSLAMVWYSTILIILSLIAFYGVSAFLIWGRAHERITVLISLFLLALGSTIVDTYLPITQETVRATYPLVRFTIPILTTVGWGGFVLFVALFPDGHHVAPWARIAVLYPFLLTIWNSIVPIQSSLQIDNWPPLLNLTGIVTQSALGIYVVFYRYRYVASPRQRQQIKWVGIGTIFIFGLLLTFFVLRPMLLMLGVTPPPIVFELLRGLTGFSLTLIPVTILIAILQYRLWDIDLIIRRTLQYAVVTAVLALTYFGGVVLLQTLLNQVTGSDSPLAVVASTLLIAALFNPLRTRVQGFIDRRFYRQKYDMQQTLEEFSEIARDEVVLEQIEQALVSTVHDTMRPEHVSLWLASPKSTGKQS